jgi:signal transduction histidine kinase
MAQLAERRTAAAPKLSASRLAVLAAALLTAPFVLLLQELIDARIAVVAIVVGASIVALLVLLRLAGFVTGLDRLRHEESMARAEADFARHLLQEQNALLREADRMKDEFVALISHDLRTPLTSIMGYLELALENEDLPETERRYLEVVERNSERLMYLVNDLLFVARLEAGEMDIHLDALDLATVVSQAVEEAGPRARAKEIVLESATDSVPTVSADRGRMFQLLDNLVGNAIKFTPAGGKVEVRLTRRGEFARLEVEDSGIGIAPKDQGRLFERFFRTENTRNGQVSGTGLGLYIARAIVEAHGGSIDFSSALGTGTCFCVELPLAD